MIAKTTCSTPKIVGTHRSILVTDRQVLPFHSSANCHSHLYIAAGKCSSISCYHVELDPVHVRVRSWMILTPEHGDQNSHSRNQNRPVVLAETHGLYPYIAQRGAELRVRR